MKKATMLSFVVCIFALAIPQANAQDSIRLDCRVINDSTMRTECEHTEALFVIQLEEGEMPASSVDVDIIREQLAVVEMTISQLEVVDIDQVRDEFRSNLRREREARLEQLQEVRIELEAMEAELEAQGSQISDLTILSGVINTRLEELMNPETGIIPQLMRDVQGLAGRVSQLEVRMDAVEGQMEEFDVRIGGRGIFGSTIAATPCFSLQIPLQDGNIRMLQRNCAGLTSHEEWFFTNSIEFTGRPFEDERVNIGGFLEDQVNEADIEVPGNSDVAVYAGPVLDFELGAHRDGHLVFQLGFGPGWEGPNRDLEFVWTSSLALEWNFLSVFGGDDDEE